jgi:hypothetical protein
VTPGSWSFVGGSCEFDVDGRVCCVSGALAADDGFEGDGVAVSENC